MLLLSELIYYYVRMCHPPQCIDLWSTSSLLPVLNHYYEAHSAIVTPPLAPLLRLLAEASELLPHHHYLRSTIKRNTASSSCSSSPSDRWPRQRELYAVIVQRQRVAANRPSCC